VSPRRAPRRVGIFISEFGAREREAGRRRRASASGHGGHRVGEEEAGRPAAEAPLLEQEPSDRSSTAEIRTYLFAVNLHKESVERFAIYPAVPGTLEQITFSMFESVFLSGSTRFTFSDIYSFATEFIMLIKCSFKLHFCPFKFR
jgi:hypothetical protein